MPDRLRPQQPPRYRLVLAANRDLRSGGSWLGVTREGKLAAVTNYRDPAHRSANRFVLPFQSHTRRDSPHLFS